MEFFFYDPFDDLSMIQSHLDQLQREMDATQQKRRQSGKSNSSSAAEKAAKKGEAAATTTKKELKIEHSPEEEEEKEEAVSTWWPAVDVRETERGYELYVELPGVKKEDVKIELHKEGSGKYLIVSGKKERFVLPPPEEEEEEKKEKEEKKEEEEKMVDEEEEKEEEKKEEEKKDEKKEKEFEMWHREERVYGYFERAFSVPVETEGDEIRAKFENGVLAVSFPKHEAAKAPAKVAIQID